ncbi:MAG TPA: cupin domain-containing protein [Thermoleophilaceae bacterium]|nr:cupin domain-containing protein [Thermoleophilaceae bacterium]
METATATDVKIVTEPGEGDSVSLGGVGVDFKISGEVTGGAFSIVEHPLDPGRLIPPHIHYKEDELSYVVRGEVGVRIGDRDFVAGPGSYVFKPRDVPHTFWNAGPEPAHLIELITPAGFEEFFARLGELVATCTPEELPERRAELAREYDHYFVHPEWVPELQEKHGLKLIGEE